MSIFFNENVDPKYSSLVSVYEKAYEHAALTKGKERHANDKDFLQQPIMEIGRMVGLGYPLGQAKKKVKESIKLLSIKGIKAAQAELLGAINYCVAAYLLIEEKDEYNIQLQRALEQYEKEK